MKRLIKNGVLVDAQGEYRQDLLIENGVIRARAADIQPDGETEVIDASGCYVMPGGIDVHTHFNIDVGIARSCDDFFSGTRAAACGGTTTNNNKKRLIDFFLHHSRTKFNILHCI